MSTRLDADRDATLTPGMSKAMQEAASEANENTLRAVYKSKLGEFSDGTGFMGVTLPLNMGSLKWLMSRKNRNASLLVADEDYSAATQRLESYLLHTMTDGNAEDFRKWYVPVRNSVRNAVGKKPTAPKMVVLFLRGLDDSNTQERLLKELLVGKPEVVLEQALIDFDKGAKYVTADEQYALLTAIVALQPSLLEGKRHEERAENRLVSGLLARTAENGAKETAKQIVDLDMVGEILRKRARKNISTVSGDVFAAIVENAKQPAFAPVQRKWLPFAKTRAKLLNAISPIPVNAIDAIGSAIMGSHHRTAAQSRAFLRLTDAAVVGPHLLKGQAIDFAAADAVRDRSIEADEQSASLEIAALRERKTRGVRAFMARQRYIGGMFAGLADARSARIQNQMNKVVTKRDTLRQAAFADASKQRALMFRDNLCLAASLTVFHNGAKRSKLRNGHGQNLFLMIQEGLQTATIGESTTFLAVASQFMGGLPKRERAIMALPVTYEPVMNKNLGVMQHSDNLLALASGIQRSPEALPGYLQALFLKGQLPETIAYMQGQAEVGDKHIRNESALLAQALGATYKAFKGTAHEAEFEKAQASFAASIAPAELNERYLKGCVSGMDDFSRGDEALRKSRRVSMRIWRGVTAKRPAIKSVDVVAAETPETR